MAHSSYDKRAIIHSTVVFLDTSNTYMVKVVTQ